MPVPAAGDWAGKLDTSGVNGLEYAGVVDPSGDFLNEDGGKSLAPQFLVDAEEVDLDGGKGLLAAPDFGGDAGDEANQHSLCGSDPKVESFGEARGGEGPLEEVVGVVEAEHAVFVLDVVFVEEIVELVLLGFV